MGLKTMYVMLFSLEAMELNGDTQEMRIHQLSEVVFKLTK